MTAHRESQGVLRLQGAILKSQPTFVAAQAAGSECVLVNLLLCSSLKWIGI